MGQHTITLPSLLHFFTGIIQEKINQDGVDLALGLGMVPLDFPAKQLDAPDATPADLDFHSLARRELL